MKAWELDTGRDVMTLRGHRAGLCALQFDADKLITGSEDRTVRVWDYRTEKELSVFYGHKAWVRCLYFNEDYLWTGYAWLFRRSCNATTANA